VGPDHGPDLGAQDLEAAGDLLADLLLEAICGLGRRPVDHENPAEGLEPMVLGGHVHDAVQRLLEAEGLGERHHRVVLKREDGPDLEQPAQKGLGPADPASLGQVVQGLDVKRSHT
jgi:hypothetical protein